MKIVRAGNQHIPDIQRIVAATWPAAYESILSAGQIEYMIGQFYNDAALSKQIQDGQQFMLAFAEDDQAKGFAGYEFDYEPRITKLHKLYVLPETQGTGLGKLLLDAVNAEAATAGQQKLTLNVNRYNKALDFYTKAGFRIVTEADIDIGNGYFMNDYVLERGLQ